MVIDNSNVIGIMINVIKSDYPQESKTLVGVFDFLTALAFKNEKVQTELFDFVNDMLRCESSDQVEDEEGEGYLEIGKGACACAVRCVWLM